MYRPLTNWDGVFHKVAVVLAGLHTVLGRSKAQQVAHVIKPHHQRLLVHGEKVTVSKGGEQVMVRLHSGKGRCVQVWLAHGVRVCVGGEGRGREMENVQMQASSWFQP